MVFIFCCIVFNAISKMKILETGFLMITLLIFFATIISGISLKGLYEVIFLNSGCTAHEKEDSYIRVDEEDDDDLQISS